MSKRDKAIERLRQNPKSVRFDEIDRLLLSLGFEKRQRGTSHATYSKGRNILTIPFHKPHILPVYVKNVLHILDEIGEFSEEE